MDTSMLIAPNSPLSPPEPGSSDSDDERADFHSAASRLMDAKALDALNNMPISLMHSHTPPLHAKSYVNNRRNSLPPSMASSYHSSLASSPMSHFAQSPVMPSTPPSRSHNQSHSHSHSHSQFTASAIHELENAFQQHTQKAQALSNSDNSSNTNSDNSLSSVLSNTATLHKAVMASTPLNFSSPLILGHLNAGKMAQPLMSHMSIASLPPLALSFSSQTASTMGPATLAAAHAVAAAQAAAMANNQSGASTMVLGNKDTMNPSSLLTSTLAAQQQTLFQNATGNANTNQHPSQCSLSSLIMPSLASSDSSNSLSLAVPVSSSNHAPRSPSLLSSPTQALEQPLTHVGSSNSLAQLQTSLFDNAGQSLHQLSYHQPPPPHSHSHNHIPLSLLPTLSQFAHHNHPHHSLSQSRCLAWPTQLKSHYDQQALTRYLVHFPHDTAHGAQSGLYQPGKPSQLCLTLIHGDDASRPYHIKIPVKVALKPTVKRTAKLRIIHELSLHPAQFDCETKDLGEEEKRWETGSKIKKPQYLLLRQDTKSTIHVVHVVKWTPQEMANDDLNGISQSLTLSHSATSHTLLSPLHLIPVTEESLAHVQTKGRGKTDDRRKETAQLYLSLKVDRWYELRCHSGWKIVELEMKHHKGGHQISASNISFHALPEHVNSAEAVQAIALLGNNSNANTSTRASTVPVKAETAAGIGTPESKPINADSSTGTSANNGTSSTNHSASKSDHKESQQQQQQHQRQHSNESKKRSLNINVSVSNSGGRHNENRSGDSGVSTNTSTGPSTNSNHHIATPLSYHLPTASSPFGVSISMSPTSPSTLYNLAATPTMFDSALFASGGSASPSTLLNLDPQQRKLLALNFAVSSNSAFTVTAAKQGKDNGGGGGGKEEDDSGNTGTHANNAKSKRRKTDEGRVAVGGDPHSRTDTSTSVTTDTKSDTSTTLPDSSLLQSMPSIGDFMHHKRTRDISSLSAVLKLDADGTLHSVFDGPLLRSESSNSINGTINTVTLHPFHAPSPAPMLTNPFIRTESATSINTALSAIHANSAGNHRGGGHGLPPAIKIPTASRLSPSLSPTLGQSFGLSLSPAPGILAPLGSYASLSSPTPTFMNDNDAMFGGGLPVVRHEQ